MKNFIYIFFLIALSFLIGWYSVSFLSGKWELFGVFFAGIDIGIVLMLLRLNVKNNKINLYRRELEKESISADKNSARVKVLESKIVVLEKALENALKK